MPRRGHHRIFRVVAIGFCFLSLLGCVATAWLIRRSYRDGGQQWRIRPQDVRYTVRTTRGRVVVFKPPGYGSATDLAAAKAWLSSLPADGTLAGWRVVRLDDGKVYGEPPRTIAGARMMKSLDVTRPLLDALEDPKTLAAAHIGLTQTYAPTGRRELPSWPDGWTADRKLRSGAAWYYGLRIDFRIDGPLYGGGPPETGRIDPAQLPAIRDYWHDRFDTVAWSAPIWPLGLVALSPTALLLAIRTRRAWVRRGRSRRGLCLACGYDLRAATSGRCSECGEVAAAPAPAVAAGHSRNR